MAFLCWKVAAALLLVRAGGEDGGWWPFGGGESSGSGGGSGAPKIMVVREMRPSMLSGVPLVAEGHFGGFDPWEDLHKNVEKVVTSNAVAKPGASGGPFPVAFSNGMPMGIEMQLGAIFQAFAGLQAGQVGRSEGSFEVQDDHQTSVQITAQLPGYKLKGADLDSEDPSASPLSVKVVGKRSIVVSGRQEMGPITKQWQRSFQLPLGCNTTNISVTFSASSGNLTVMVPRKPESELTDEDKKDEDDFEEDHEGFDDMMPPALRAMRHGLPGIIEQMGAAGDAPSGFLTQRRHGGMMPELLTSMGQLHPRNHAPHEKPVPEDVEVNLIGCYAESQLAKAELKYYGESNAVSFASMYWHAQADAVPFFAMARHDDLMGHAFTFRGFAHEDEKPQWGSYDGCGSPCDDDDTRWCGCAAEGERHLPNHNCPEGEKRFAVYKAVVAPAVGSGTSDAAPAADGEPPAEPLQQGEKGEAQQQQQQQQEQEQQPEPQPPQEHRTYWQLAQDGNDAHAIDIVVPKGQNAEVRGKWVFVSDGTSEGDASLADGADSSDENTPLGKVKLPSGVVAESCQWDDAQTKDNGDRVMRCSLEKDQVKHVPIRIVDEL